MPIAGTLDNFNVGLSGSPGSSRSYAFTINLDGVATGLSCTISGSAVSCPDTGAVAVSAGQDISILVKPGNTPQDNLRVRWTATFAPTA